MKIFISFICLCLSVKGFSQVSSVSLQASGLTCSMCSNAINKSLQTIPFVEKVEPNIKTSTFIITIKPGAVADFDLLKDKVEDAGFFVADMEATINFDNTQLVNDSHVAVGNYILHFLNSKDQTLNGNKKLRIIDKGFVPVKEYKKNQRFTLMECYKTGVAGSCCSKDGLKTGSRIFHVTLS